MNISMHLAVAMAAAACLCVVAAAPEGRLARTKQQRPTRAYKNDGTNMFARGFGKRDRPHTRAEHQDSYEGHPRRKYKPNNKLMVAYDFGKRSGNDDISDEVYGLDNFWEMLEAAPEREGQETNDDKTLESIPVDWFVSELLNNPDFARSVVRKFIDLNQDDMLSTEELLRNVV